MVSPSSGLLHPVRISSSTIPGNVFLGPMAGYTDAAYRSICVDFGATLCFTEMASAEALARANRKTRSILDRAGNEKLIGFQIFASAPRSAADAVRFIAPLKPDIIDLNCGCSVPKVLKGGCGAVLLRDPNRIGMIVGAMRGETDIPVSVKLRSGWDQSTINYLQCAEAAVRAGASMVSLHPRSRAQGFSGKARWEEIRELSANCPVPVFGSGDLFTAADCASMLTRTGCDGVMIARGSLGNPFIFAEVKALLSGSGNAPIVDARLRLSTALEHLRRCVAMVGEPKACRDMRKHFMAYTRGMEGGAIMRQSVVSANTVADYEEIVQSYLRA